MPQAFTKGRDTMAACTSARPGIWQGRVSKRFYGVMFRPGSRVGCAQLGGTAAGVAAVCRGMEGHMVGVHRCA